MTFTGEDSPLANLMPSGLAAVAKFERALLRNASARALPFFPPIHSKSTSQIAPKGNSWIATVTEVVERSLDLVLVRTKYSINEQRTGCKRPR